MYYKKWTKVTSDPTLQTLKSAPGKRLRYATLPRYWTGFRCMYNFRVSCDILLCKNESIRLDYTACKLNTVERSYDLSNNYRVEIEILVRYSFI